MLPTQPTLDGFIAFVRSQMGIPSSILPDDADIFPFAYDLSIAEVNEQIAAASPPFYVFAVNNLAGDYLINYAVDTPPSTYFADLRKSYNISTFVAGVIESSADQSTSQTFAVPESLRELTLSDLQHLKTPWGREYLAIAQKVGSQWGIN